MNETNESGNTRKRTIWIAMLVALMGLTIAPGASFTYEKNADGSSKTSVQTEEE